MARYDNMSGSTRTFAENYQKAALEKLYTLREQKKGHPNPKLPPNIPTHYTEPPQGRREARAKLAGEVAAHRQIKVEEDEKQKAADEKAALKYQLESLRAQNAELERKNEELTQQTSNQEIDALKNELQETKDQLELTQDELELSRKEVEEEAGKTRMAADQLKETKQKLATVSNQRNQAEEVKAKLKADKQRILGEKSTLLKRLRAYERERPNIVSPYKKQKKR